MKILRDKFEFSDIHLAGVLAIFRFVILWHIHRTRASFKQKSGGCVDPPGLHSVLIEIRMCILNLVRCQRSVASVML